MRKIGFDRAVLEDKVIEEDDDYLVMSAVIAREIVQRYPQGKAYKPGDELEKAARIFSSLVTRPLTTKRHPDMGLVMRGDEVHGRVENLRFVKDLVDPKTKRPMDRGLRADLRFFKRLLSPQLVDDLKNGERRDVSIGFTYDEDPTSGEWRNQKYDFVQRNIFIDHVAAGLPVGRCPSPYCGIGIDELGKVTNMNEKIGGDPWEETEENIRSGHRSPDDFDPDSMRTIDITEGVKAVVGCPKGKYEGGKCTVGMQIQSYLFDKEKFTMAEAKAWFKEHKADAMSLEEIEAKIEELKTEQEKLRTQIEEFYAQREPMPTEIKEAQERTWEIERELNAFQEVKVRLLAGVDCPICDVIDDLGKLEFSKRLVKAFGKDTVLKAFLDQEGEREKAMAKAKERCGKYPVSFKEGVGNVTKPGEYEDVPEDMFGDPCNFKYPMTEEYVMAAWAYVSKEENRAKGGYSEEEWTWIQNRIKKRMEAEEHEVAEDRKREVDELIKGSKTLIARVDKILAS